MRRIEPAPSSTEVHHALQWYGKCPTTPGEEHGGVYLADTVPCYVTINREYLGEGLAGRVGELVAAGLQRAAMTYRFDRGVTHDRYMLTGRDGYRAPEPLYRGFVMRDTPYTALVQIEDYPIRARAVARAASVSVADKDYGPDPVRFNRDTCDVYAVESGEYLGAAAYEQGKTPTSAVLVLAAHLDVQYVEPLVVPTLDGHPDYLESLARGTLEADTAE